MKTTISIIMGLLFTMIFCNAQKIERENYFGGYKYTQNGKNLKMEDLVKEMKGNPEALALIKKAKSSNNFSLFLGGAGGALVGWPLGTALAGGDANWLLAGIGAGLLVIAIPVSSSANKKSKQAIDLYNSSLSSSIFREKKPELSITSSGNSIGFVLNF